MFRGRTFVDSHGAVASPAMATWNGTLVLAWCGRDGTIYFASGVEQNGVIRAAPIPFQTSMQRPALVQFGEQLILAYSGTDGNLRCAFSSDGRTFGPSHLWVHLDSSKVSQPIGGPALCGTGGVLRLAWTEASTTDLHFGFTLALPRVFEESAVLTGGSHGPTLKSLDTPALGVAPTGELLLAFTGFSPFDVLNIQPQLRAANQASPVVTYDDRCVGGPAMVDTSQGFAAAYTGLGRNLYLLHGVEALNAGQVRRSE